MLANTELTQDFSTLCQQYKKLTKALIEIVDIPCISQEIEPANASRENFQGFRSSNLYVVTSGSLTARYQDRTVFALEEGDILLPDITGESGIDSTVYYNCETGATLDVYPALEMMRRIFENPQAVKLWTQLLITYAGIMLRITASLTREDSPSIHGYERYESGEVIIRQGDRADYVFNLTEGVAEVQVDGVTVGRVEEDEIFGAMAALTHSDRSATVVAKTTCSVVKVPKDQFTELIKSNPTTIHGLLIDMANSIVNLNEQLVSNTESVN